jgi:hypothetical protein
MTAAQIQVLKNSSFKSHYQIYTEQVNILIAVCSEQSQNSASFAERIQTHCKSFFIRRGGNQRRNSDDSK